MRTRRRAAVSVGGEAGDVVLRPSREDEADGRDEAGREAAAPQYHVNQRAAGASIAVDERMNRLELCVCDGRLEHGGVVVAVAVRNQVIEQGLEFVWRWGDERRGAWVVAAAADPVLNRPDRAADLRRGRA